MKPCTNCNSVDWAAKNDEYCTDCERDWWSTFNQVVSRHENPLQEFADAILFEVRHREIRDAANRVVGFKSIKIDPIIGLKTATPEEIEELKRKYPKGYHKTHFDDGEKLPYNGIFLTVTPRRYLK